LARRHHDGGNRDLDHGVASADNRTGLLHAPQDASAVTKTASAFGSIVAWIVALFVNPQRGHSPLTVTGTVTKSILISPHLW
jgi:hypothetical protein